MRLRTAEMTKRERVAAALRGEEVDRPPFSFWGHHPPGDRTPEGQAAIHLALHEKFDLDFMKLMFHNMSLLTDFGCEFTDQWDPDLGFYLSASLPVVDVDDWIKVPTLDRASPAIAAELETLRRIKMGLADDAPVVITVLSPLMVARLLAGVPRLAEHLHAQLPQLNEALEAITGSTITFVQAALAAGADGIFYAMEYASADLTNADQFDRYAAPFDTRILRAARNKSNFTVLHLHGANIMFDKVKDWPADALNWDDRKAGPSLAAVQSIDGRCVLGGLDQTVTLVSGSEEEVRSQVADAVQETHGRSVMIGPGCSLPLKVSERNLRAAREEALKPMREFASRDSSDE